MMKPLSFLMATLTCYTLSANDYSSEKIHEDTYEELDASLADNTEEDEDGFTQEESEEDESTNEEETSEATPTQMQMSPGNHPLNNKQSYLGVATVSYLYWNAQQDGMDVATTGTYSTPNVTKTGVKGKTLTQDFPYKSGYKIGLGFNFRETTDWMLQADLTGLYQTHTTSHSAPTSTTGLGVLYLTNWFYQASSSNQNPACTHLTSTWHLGLNWFDLSVSKPFYEGSKFTLSPFGGIRNSWISQSFKLKAQNVVNFTDGPESLSTNKLSSWGIGPRLGINGRFLLGAGWRLQGNIGASLLFTKYGTISHKEQPLQVGGSTLSYNMNNYTCLRSLLETNLGLGWGTFLSRNRYHIDLSATYDFNYLWNQNMMRTLNEINIIGNSGSGMDLSLQGLTLSADFHF